MKKNKFNVCDLVKAGNKKEIRQVVEFYYSPYKKSYLYRLNNDYLYYYEKHLIKVNKTTLKEWLKEQEKEDDEN